MFVSQNTTPFLAETFPYQDKQCVKFCVAVVRATFDVDADGSCTPSKEQTPFVFADTHYGDPETTSIRVEMDFVPVKPRCEVLLDAMAIAPGGRPVEVLEVGLIGPNMQKRAIVTGQRRWFRSGFGPQASDPTPFVSMPLAWHLTFGGWDRTDPDPAKHSSDAVNPIGTGYLTRRGNIDGALLPSIEHPHSRMRIWNDRPKPVGFGPVPPFAKARARHAGTYDKHWIENVLPFLPQDFDDRYFQAAPEDQWLDKLSEGMTFACQNMNASGRFMVRLPKLEVPVRFVFGDRTEHKIMKPDTLNMVPHEGRIVLVARVAARLPRKFVKLQQVQVGQPDHELRPSKPRYAGLGEAVAALARMRGQAMTVISCVSMISPVGYSAAATCAALRAGIDAFEELDYPDSNGMPLRGARVDAIAPAMRGRERLGALARLVIEEIDPGAAVALPWSQMPVILCTRGRETPGARLNSIMSDLKLPDGSMLGERRTAHIRAGQPSAFVALVQARQMLNRGSEPACLLLALDSLIDARTLAWLDGHMRLRTSEVTDGLIPGEAACLAVVSRRPLTQRFLVVRGLGLGAETATAANEEPFRADGLTSALKDALAEARTEMHEVALRLSDVAGESDAFEELVLAQMRNMRKPRPEQPVWHAADCIGDTGAAAGLIQFAWAEQAFQRGYAPGNLAALHGSSMAFGTRAAAVVSA